MTQAQIIEQLLCKYLSLEAEIVGEQSLRAIIHGAKPSIPKHGESFDFTPVFETLAAVTTIISNLIVIYIALEGRYKRPPTLEELKKEGVKSHLPAPLNNRSDEFLKDFLDAVAPWHYQNDKDK